MNIGEKAKQIIGSVAPLIGTAIGGPFGAMAGQLVKKALGIESDNDKAVESALASGNPEVLLKLKTAELEMQTKMKELDISEEQLHASDRANARNREIALHDHTPAILAFVITVGFFGTLGYMLVKGKPETGGDALLVMLGALGAAWTAVTAYYFGSSAGSRKNQDALAQIAKS